MNSHACEVRESVDRVERQESAEAAHQETGIEDMLLEISIGWRLFQKNGSTVAAIKKENDGWNRLSLAEMVEHLYSVQSELAQDNLPREAKEASSINEVVQFLYHASLEKPVMAAISKKMAQEVMGIDTCKGRDKQGSPILWTPIVKALFHEIAGLKLKVHELSSKRLNRAIGRWTMGEEVLQLLGGMSGCYALLESM